MTDPQDLRGILEAAGWPIVHRQKLPARQETTFPVEDLALGHGFQRYAGEKFGGRLYGHQVEALRKFAEGRNVCLTTGTASGKSAVFYGAAMKCLTDDPGARIFALYPLKALGAEQEERWREALSSAGLGTRVGRVDGSVGTDEGWRVLRDCRVIIMTPDILHARILFNAGRREVRDALKHLRLVILDEVHTYTGVFGSNAAYLFRRLRHAASLLGGDVGFLGASATIRSPLAHLSQLVGLGFDEVGPELDTSKRFETHITLVRRPGTRDLLVETAELSRALLTESSRRFITFVESRKLAEMLAGVVARTSEDEDTAQGQSFVSVFERDVLPYRAGFEENDRREIQARLTNGDLRGVIATSALELGLDIGGLDTALLIGVPASSTSLRQRIGRVGRAGPGEVIVISTGSVGDEAVFANPASLLERPPAEGALYLRNRRIQYIHALCLARTGGEHDQLAGSAAASGEEGIATQVEWTEGFRDLCRRERVGEIPIELQAMKLEAGEEPNYTFPLRDVESQFKVELTAGSERQSLGSLSFSQLLREAYPGAVYRYVTMPFRVFQVYTNKKLVRVRKEKSYFTKPVFLPTQVYPNLSEGNVSQARLLGSSRLIECALQVRQAVAGYTEQRGQTRTQHPYPTDSAATGISFPLARFQRNFFTTGVVVAHPLFQTMGAELQDLAEALFEAFLSVVPFERRELDVAAEKLRVARGPLVEGARFIAFYDQTYGSLHLTDRLLEKDVWSATVRALHLAASGGVTTIATSCGPAIDALLADLGSDWKPDPDFSTDGPAPPLGAKYRVILPGSAGLNLRKGNEEFSVAGVFFSPQFNGLAYRGHTANAGDPTSGTEVWPHEAIACVEGESRMGEYDMETGVITPE